MMQLEGATPEAPARRKPHRMVSLRDGGRVALRPLRPSDRELYLAGFEHLSPATRYMRFFSPKAQLTDRELHYLLDVDHHDHEAIVAIDQRSGEGIGVARYVRDPEQPDVAEISIVVADEHQGRGLGALLIGFVAERAAAEGIARLRAMVLADNHRMVRLIRTRWPRHHVHRGQAGVLELEFEVTPARPEPSLSS